MNLQGFFGIPEGVGIAFSVGFICLNIWWAVLVLHDLPYHKKWTTSVFKSGILILLATSVVLMVVIINELYALLHQDHPRFLSGLKWLVISGIGLQAVNAWNMRDEIDGGDLLWILPRAFGVTHIRTLKRRSDSSD